MQSADSGSTAIKRKLSGPHLRMLSVAYTPSFVRFSYCTTDGVPKDYLYAHSTLTEHEDTQRATIMKLCFERAAYSFKPCYQSLPWSFRRICQEAVSPPATRAVAAALAWMQTFV
jgi:hypothetical protein